ncbi:MAG: hypothetical protein IJ776_05115 [Paludibacteraceae bacterium]|nr:hypothetical protein [Paludibacteraceae bacterium]
MNKRIYIFISSVLLSLAVFAAGENKAKEQMRIVDISRIGGDVQVVYDLPLRRPAADYQITLQPALVGSKDTFLMEPVVLQGWNNIRQLHRDHVLNHKNEPEPDYYPQRLRVNVLRDTLLLPLADYRWMLTDSVCICRMAQVKEGCCKILEQDDECSDPYSYFEEKLSELPTEKQVAGFAPVEVKQPDPATLKTIDNNRLLVPADHYTPYLKTEVLSRREDVLYVHFELDSIRLKRSFRNNASRLDTIVNAVNTMLADTMAQIRTIQIVGLASVEGSMAHNEWLAAERGKALKQYIIDHTGVADSVFEVNNGGEAWAEFGWQIENADFEGRGSVMRILNDTTIDPDTKEKRIRTINCGKPYEWIRDHLLQDQRNAGYIRVFYELRTDSAAIAINEAVEQIKEHNYDEALRLLLPYRDDPRSHEALGVAYFMTGEPEKAEKIWGTDDKQDNHTDNKQ